MRPNTNAELAQALRVQSHYANDSETLWLMHEAANRLEQAAPSGAPAAQAESLEEQNAPAAAVKPQRLPRAKASEREPNH